MQFLNFLDAKFVLFTNIPLFKIAKTTYIAVNTANKPT